MPEHAGSPDEALDLLRGSVDRYTGHDPMSLLFIETYLAATRDEELHRELGDHGVRAPEQTAAVTGRSGKGKAGEG